jgi:hypothetical protein
MEGEGGRAKNFFAIRGNFPYRQNFLTIIFYNAIMNYMNNNIRSSFTIQPTIIEEQKKELTREDLYTNTNTNNNCSCIDRNDDNCWCFMGIGRRHDYNNGIDRFFNFKEKHGFTDIIMDVNTGCIMFSFEGEKYYYGPMARKFKKKGTNKWFSWSNRNGKKKSKVVKEDKVEGVCIGCNKIISKLYTRCYNCFMDYNEDKADRSIKKS